MPNSVAPGLHPTKWLTDGYHAAERAIVSAHNKRERFEKAIAEAVKGLAEADLELAEAMSAKFELEMALAVFEVDPNAPPPECPDSVKVITDQAGADSNPEQAKTDTTGGA